LDKVGRTVEKCSNIKHTFPARTMNFEKKNQCCDEKNDVIVAIKNMSSIHFNGFIKGVNEYMDNNNILFKIK
jgi:hypothetical protein